MFRLYYRTSDVPNDPNLIHCIKYTHCIKYIHTRRVKLQLFLHATKMKNYMVDSKTYLARESFAMYIYIYTDQSLLQFKCQISHVLKISKEEFIIYKLGLDTEVKWIA